MRGRLASFAPQDILFKEPLAIHLPVVSPSVLESWKTVRSGHGTAPSLDAPAASLVPYLSPEPFHGDPVIVSVL